MEMFLLHPMQIEIEDMMSPRSSLVTSIAWVFVVVTVVISHPGVGR
jgi:hypothetical protein